MGRGMKNKARADLIKVNPTYSRKFFNKNKKKRKTMEVRVGDWKYRGVVYIVRTGDSRLEGVVDMVDSRPVSLKYLTEHADETQVEPRILKAMKKNYETKNNKPVQFYVYIFENAVEYNPNSTPLFHLTKRGQVNLCVSDFGEPLYNVEYLKFWDEDDQGQWFVVWWLGYFFSWSFQMRENLPFDDKFLDKVVARGNGDRVTRTEVGGCGYRDLSSQVIPHPVSHVDEMPDLLFQSEKDRCIQFAFANVMALSKKKAKLLTILGPSSTIAMLADLVNRRFRVTLERQDWAFDILQTRGGRYILYGGGHCIGVDAKLKLIFDCAEQKAKSLTIDNIEESLKYGIDEIRRIV